MEHDTNVPIKVRLGHIDRGSAFSLCNIRKLRDRVKAFEPDKVPDELHRYVLDLLGQAFPQTLARLRRLR